LIQWESGGVRLSLVDAGEFWLDGGAMFGVVPKPLWEREREPDERNRIRLAMNLLLVDDGKERTLVDTGAGDKWNEKSRGIYRLGSRRPEEYLGEVGLDPTAIDRVVCTHLHFDHAGGNTAFAADGRLVAVFPNAEYVVQRGELEMARWDNERIRASYVPENFEPLARDGRLRIVDGDVDLSPRLRLRVAPGHTPWMQIVLVATDEGTVCFLADLVPTASHVRYPFIMGYDLEPLRTLESKKRFLPVAHAEGWRLIFEHDPLLPLGELELRDGHLAARPWRPES